MNSLSNVLDDQPLIYVIKKIDSHRLVKKYASSSLRQRSQHTSEFENTSSIDRSKEKESTPIDAKFLITPCSVATKNEELSSNPKGKKDYKQHYYKRVHDLVESELDVLSIITHPNIVQYYGYSLTNGIYNIKLEYCSGGDLYKYLTHKDRLDDDFIRKFVVDVSSALIYIHEKHIIHRDIKLQNILLCPVGGDWTFKITDFGFATSVPPKDIPKSSMTPLEKKFFKICGTPYYMAPELMALSKTKDRVTNITDYNNTVDVWSFGICIYELFTGNFPFPRIDEMDGLVPLMEFLSGGESSSNYVNAKINMHIPKHFKPLLYKMLRFTDRCTADRIFLDHKIESEASEAQTETTGDKVADSWIRVSGTESSLSLPHGEEFKSTFLKWLLKH